MPEVLARQLSIGAPAICGNISDTKSMRVSLAAIGVCVPNGNSEPILPAVYKSPGHAWSDEDVIKLLLNFRLESLLAGELSAKNPVSNSRVSNSSGERELELFDGKDFQISVQHFFDYLFPKEVVTFSILYSIKMPDCQLSLSPST
jgi:hypothetical protein